MNLNLNNFSIASLKNTFDEVRAQVYPKNETERKVLIFLLIKNQNKFNIFALF
jgi:hypothetical protein